jgi:NAD(P)-dependent dehydrogenase (short-subunit alcohol dehydrogenase family)
MIADSESQKPVSLVTGGGGDIGRAIAVRLARICGGVAIVDIDEQAAGETARLIEATGVKTLVIRADVSSASDTSYYVETAENELGPIGIFANNAGMEGLVAPLHEYPEEIFDQLYQVNVKGIFLGLKYVLGKMRQRGTGAIVNTASTSAIRGRAGLAGYVSSKHAVLGLTRTAAVEVVGTGIRVNAVLPGPIESRMIRELDDQATRSTSAPGRAGSAGYGQPQHIADVVAFLATAEAAHVNGAAWVVDGGMTVP